MNFTKIVEIQRVVMLLMLTFLVAAASVRAEGGPADDPVVIRVIHPERQAGEILRLFEGSRAPHPAAALAAWKPAAAHPNQLGKPLEAVISLFNPEMAQEWSSLHDAVFRLRIDPETLHSRWSVMVPHDDGTLEAMITSLRLSGGVSEPPLGQGDHFAAVERLGGPNAPEGLKSGTTVRVADSRETLAEAIKTRPETLTFSPDDAIDSGLLLRLLPASLPEAPAGPVPSRRLITLARGLGLEGMVGHARVVDDRFELSLDSRPKDGHSLQTSIADGLTLDRDWLSSLPVDEVVAFVSVPIGGDARYWDAIFQLADQIDRSDPARAGLAPLRTRVNLVAAAARVALEADLWPHLRGLSLAVLAEPRAGAEQSGTAQLLLQMDDEASASKLANELLPRLSVLWGGMKTLDQPGAAATRHVVGLGRVSGQPLEAAARGRSVLVSWGNRPLADAARSTEPPARSLLAAVEPFLTSRDGKPVQRLAVVWPGRLSWVAKTPPSFRLASESLEASPPMVWTGWERDGHTFDRVEWRSLRSTVHRVLETVLPQPAPGQPSSLVPRESH